MLRSKSSLYGGACSPGLALSLLSSQECVFKRQSQETYLLPLDVMEKSLNLDSKDLDFNSNNRQWLWLPGWQKAFPEDLLGPGKKLVR